MTLWIKENAVALALATVLLAFVAACFWAAGAAIRECEAKRCDRGQATNVMGVCICAEVPR